MVNVPVLSVHITVTEPTIPTADNLRTAAPRAAIRAPMARNTLNVGSRPSGTRAQPLPVGQGERHDEVRAGGGAGEEHRRQAGEDRHGGGHAGERGDLALEYRRPTMYVLDEASDFAQGALGGR